MPEKSKKIILGKKEKSRRNTQVKMSYAALRKVLKEFDVPELYYSIGSQVDDSVCIEYINGKWIVYEGTRGHKINVRSFPTVYEAGCELFESVVIGEKKLRQMRRRLKRRLSIPKMKRGEYAIVFNGSDIKKLDNRGVIIDKGSAMRKPKDPTQRVVEMISSSMKRNGVKVAACSKPKDHTRSVAEMISSSVERNGVNVSAMSRPKDPKQSVTDVGIVGKKPAYKIKNKQKVSIKHPVGSELKGAGDFQGKTVARRRFTGIKMKK